MNDKVIAVNADHGLKPSEPRKHLFVHETPKYMGIPQYEFDLLGEFGLLPPLQQVRQTCIFYFLVADIDELKGNLAPGGKRYGRLDFLNSLDREE